MADKGAKPKYFHGDYGHGTPPILSPTVEGPHGYCNILQPNETPDGIDKVTGITSKSKDRNTERGK